MKFKEFVKWCNYRAADGCWSFATAKFCIDIINAIREQPFWKREKFWKSEYEEMIVRDIVKPIEEKMKERGMEDSL